jgi:hypothetical protein
MTMNPTPRKMNDEDQDLVKEYLKKGGTVTIGNKFERTQDIEMAKSFYGRPKKKKE